MKIYYDHRYGKIEKCDLLVSSIYATEVEDPDKALDQGFLQQDNNLWYNCRSTRVDCKQYKSVPNAIEFLSKTLTTYDINQLTDLYYAFIKLRRFNPIPDDLKFLSNDIVIEYHDKNQLVGFSKIRTYKNSIELNLHCNIIEDKKFSKLTMLNEIDYFYNQYEYIYLGPGYETSSIYKSSVAGFQWWDGQRWRIDKANYNILCKQDSEFNPTSN